MQEQWELSNAESSSLMRLQDSYKMTHVSDGLGCLLKSHEAPANQRAEICQPNKALRLCCEVAGRCRP